MKNSRIAFVHYPFSVNHARLETMPFAFNAVVALASAGWKIDLFLWESPSSIYIDRVPGNVNIVWAEPLRQTGTKQTKLSKLWSIVRNLWRLGYFKSFIPYKCVFGVGRIGVSIAYCISLAGRVPLVYFNDEFPSELVPSRFFGYMERLASRAADIIVIPDQCRHEPLYEELNLELSKPYSVIPNTTREKTSEVNINWHKYYDIPEDKLLFVNAGTLADWTEIPELLCTLPYWPDNTVLILHSRSRGIRNYKKQLSHVDFPGRLIWSNDPLSEAELNSLISYSLGSFGLYRNTGPNIEYIGKSSGKLMRSIFCGTPVIASKYDSLKFIEDNGLGVLVSHPFDIPQAVRNMIGENEIYRRKCQIYTETADSFEETWEGFCGRLNEVTNLNLSKR